MFLLHLLLLLKITSRCSSLEVPVLLIDPSNVINTFNLTISALYKLSDSEFTSIVHEAVRKSDLIVIFTEDSLSVEDIARKDSEGTLFPNLHRALISKKMSYMPAVENPYNVLQRIFLPSSNVFNVSLFNLYSNLEQMRTDTSYIYINLMHPKNETLLESLRNHDFIINEILASLSRKNQSTPVVALYTGRNNQLYRRTKYVPLIEPRKSNLMMNEDEVFVSSSNMLYHLRGIHYKPSLRSTQIEIPYDAEEKWMDDNYLRTSMTFSNFKLNFDFQFGPSYWRIEKIHLLEGGEEVGSVRMGVGAPVGYSFVCLDPIVLVNKRDGSQVTIQKYQILPMTESVSGRRTGSMYRSDPKVITRQDTNAHILYRSLRNGLVANCGQYFDDVILAVLLVVFLLLFIFFYGVTALSNLHTNDKYDDPHGKPLHFTTEL